MGTARGELSEFGDFVKAVVEKMDVGPFEISESEEAEVVVYELGGLAARHLGAGDGRGADALQLLMNQAATTADPDGKRVVLEVEGNAEARETFLERLADRVVARAREGGRAVALDPMSGRDRRIIHLAVRDLDDIASMSKGEGRYRQVVIVPEGAGEFAEAKRQSEAANQAD